MATSPFSRAIAGDRPLVWCYEYGAALAGEDPAALPTDAGALARSLTACVDVFGVPAVAPTFDPTLEADAIREALPVDSIETADDAFAVAVEDVLGDSRIETALDATDRLGAELDDASVVGSLTGPRTILESLPASEDPDILEETSFLVEDVLVALANAYLERGAAGLLIQEPAGPSDGAGSGEALTPVANVAGHYDAVSLLLVDDATERDVELAADVGIDALAANEDVEDRLEGTVPADLDLGKALAPEQLGEGSSVGAPHGAFLTTHGPVPRDVDPEIIHALMD